MKKPPEFKGKVEKGNVIIEKNSFRILLIYFDRQKKIAKLGSHKLWNDMQKEIDTYIEQCKAVLK